jgi:hypothetical protein
LNSLSSSRHALAVSSILRWPLWQGKKTPKDTRQQGRRPGSAEARALATLAKRAWYPVARALSGRPAGRKTKAE